MGNTESCDYKYYTDYMEDPVPELDIVPEQVIPALDIVPEQDISPILDIVLSKEQITSRNSSIHKLWYDMQTYLHDIKETLEYVRLDSSGEVIRISKWLYSINIYFTRMIKHYKIPDNLPDNHWIYNHEIVENIKKYSKENNISLRIESDADNYIFIFN